MWLKSSGNGSVGTMASQTLNKRIQYVAVAAVISVTTVIAMYTTNGTNGMMKIAPLAFLVPMFAFVATSERQKKEYDPKRLMNEAPTAIGMMAVKMMSGGSFDSAVRDVAANGPNGVSKLFSTAVKNVDLRLSVGIKESVNDVMVTLHRDTAPFRRSVMMLSSASESKDEIERRRMIKDAETISLVGLREMSESYSSSLNSPCMLIFGLGVMVPMILMSVLPMLSIGGMFSVSMLDGSMISFITLVAVPGIVAVVVVSVIGNNPFMEKRNDKRGFVYALPMIVAFPVFTAAFFTFDDVPISILIAGISAGVAGFVSIYPIVLKEKKRTRTEEALDHMLFEIGNRLLSGENFETAMTISLRTLKDTAVVASVFERTLLLSKGDVLGTISSVLDPYSERCAGMYLRIYESSLKDPRESGRLAISLGHQVQDQVSVKKSIIGKLKSMMDMMTGTSAIFAPLIMGLNLVLLKPLSSVSGTAVSSDVTVVLMLYLIELALLISVLTAYLGSKGSIVNVVHRFSMILPVALIVFVSFSVLNI